VEANGQRQKEVKRKAKDKAKDESKGGVHKRCHISALMIVGEADSRLFGISSPPPARIGI
jgi:hypothetical protein